MMLGYHCSHVGYTTLGGLKVTNTQLLCYALGWQGGTIHQVAEATGLSTDDILTLDKYQPTDSWEYGGGGTAIRTCSLPYLRQNIYPKEMGNINFWKGVLEGQKHKIKYGLHC